MKSSLLFRLLLIGIFFLGSPGTHWAQQSVKHKTKKSLKQKTLEVAVNPRLYFNKMNLFYDDFHPDPLNTKAMNVDMHLSALTFRKTTPKGFMYGFGIDLGTRTTNLNIRYGNLAHYSSQPPYRDMGYSTQIKFVGYTYCPRVFIGHKKKIKNTLWGIELGLSKQFFFNGFSDSYGLRVDPSTSPLVDPNRFAHVELYLGNGGDKLNGPLFWDAFIGIYDFKQPWMPKGFNVGLTSTLLFGYPLKPWVTPSGSQAGIATVTNFYSDANSYHKKNRTSSVSGDAYLPLDFSIGVKMSMALYRF